MRSGASGSSSACLDLLQRPVAGGEVAGPLGLVQRRAPASALRATVSCSAFLSPRCGTRIDDPAAPQAGEPLLEGGGVLGQRGHQHLARDRVAELAVVQLEQEALDQAAGVGVVDLVGDPAALAADPAAAHVEDLHGDLERVLGRSATTSASVPSPSTTCCFSIARLSAPMSSRSRAARS